MNQPVPTVSKNFFYGWMSQNYDGFLNTTLPETIHLESIYRILSNFYPGKSAIETTRKDIQSLINQYIPMLNQSVIYTIEGKMSFRDYLAQPTNPAGNALIAAFGLQTEQEYYKAEDTLKEYVEFQRQLWKYFCYLINEDYHSEDYDLYQTELKRLYMPVTFKVKRHFDRCRPSLASYHFLTPLTYQYTISGPHPEFTSGHSMQGILFGYLFWKRYSSQLHANQDILNLLAKYSVDCGVRRLIAGIHNPSTHLGSVQLFRLLNPIQDYLPYWNAYNQQLEKYFGKIKFFD